MDSQRILQYKVDGKRTIRIGSSTGFVEASVYVALCVLGLSLMAYLLFFMVPLTAVLGITCLLSRNWDPVTLPWGAWALQVVTYHQTIWIYVRGMVATVLHGAGPPPLSMSDERRWAEAKRHGLVTDDEFKARTRSSFVGLRRDSATPAQTYSRPVATPHSRRNSRQGSFASLARFAPVASSAAQIERAFESEPLGAAALDESDDEQIVWMAKTFAQSFQQAPNLRDGSGSHESRPGQPKSRATRSTSPTLSRTSLRPVSRDGIVLDASQNSEEQNSASRTPNQIDAIHSGQNGSGFFDRDYHPPYHSRGSSSTVRLAQDEASTPRTPIYGRSTSNLSTTSLISSPANHMADIGLAISEDAAMKRRHKRSRTGERIRYFDVS